MSRSASIIFATDTSAPLLNAKRTDINCELTGYISWYAMHVLNIYPQKSILSWTQGRYEGGQGSNNSPGAELLQGAQKVPTITCTFFNTEHLLRNDPRFEHGGSNLTSYPGRHLTSLRPCLDQKMHV